MEKLSNDTIENIFCQVPTESLLQCQRVCKPWRSRLRLVYPKVGLLFLSVHVASSLHNNKSIRLDYVDDSDHYRHIDTYVSRSLLLCNDAIVGSCNGLLCLKVLNYLKTLDACREDPTLISNPVTGESAVLPSLIDPKAEWKWLVGGFGYVHSTNEYKVVRIKFRDASEGGHAEVCTLGSSRWRRIGKVPYTFWLSGIFANGALHWVAASTKPSTTKHNKLPEPVIVAFDLEKEMFQLVPPPPIDYRNRRPDNYCIKLLTMRGNLRAVHHHGRCLDIWSFNKDPMNHTSREACTEDQQQYYYDCSWSWSKEFTVPCRFMERYEPFDITVKNRVLLWRNKRDLYSYDPKTLTLTKVMEARDRIYQQTVPHMNSLVSLKEVMAVI